MRENQIKIEPFEFVSIQELKIMRMVNDHARASVSVQIKDVWEERYIGILSGEIWVKITGISGEVHTVLFHGVVTDYAFSHDGHGTVMELSLASGSILMDLQPHFRVFQNKKTLCTAVYEQITGTYPDGRVIVTDGADDRTAGVLIQHHETDWEFLRRTAARTGRFMVADAPRKGVRYILGLPEGIQRKLPTDQLRTRLDMREYMEKTRGGMDWLRAADMTELIITDREICQIGDWMPYNGNNYYIYRIFTDYLNGECIHTYHLRKKEAVHPLPMPHESVTGCAFDAVVTGVQRDRVQVRIAGDEWKAQDGKKWFLYSTVYSSPDGTGWYCMPEEGDSVRLYVPDREENSFVMSAVHRQTDAARQNPEYKSFKTKYGKEILFTPDSILMTNNQGMMVEMNDNEGIMITSDKDIVVAAKEDLTIASGNASLLIAADNVLQVRQGGTSMTLNKDISFTGGEFRIQ